MMPSRIVFCGDFLRCQSSGVSTQNSNVLWLYHLAGPVLKALGHERQTCVADLAGIASSKLASEFYQSVGMTPGFESWARIFERNCSPRQLALLAEQFAGSLVVSFELPDIIVKGFVQLGIPFVDFAIHPARFMNDLAFLLRTNIYALRDNVIKWAMADMYIEMEANAVKSTYAQRPPLELPDSKFALIACQVNIDRALIHNGRFLDFTNFMPEMAAICAEYEIVLVKPHPYQPKSPMADFLFMEYGNTRIAPNDFYGILCDPRLCEVCSITSSASIEARWFGKKGIHFGDSRLLISEHECSPETGLQTGAVFMVADFWRDVLAALDLPYREADIPVIPLNVRRTLNQYWGATKLYK